MTNIHIISGGTVSYIRPHLALCAPAYGTTGEKLFALCGEELANSSYQMWLHPTKMVDGSSRLETNEDVSKLLDELIANENTHIIFMPVALCDFDVKSVGDLPIGKNLPRLLTAEGNINLHCTPSEKLIGKIRKNRKDIFLVAFKTTTGASEDQMFEAGLNLLKKNSCNLVLVNDLQTRLNMIVMPELARYCITTDREKALKELVEVTKARSNLTFHRTNVVDGDLLSWDFAPNSLRKVVDHCIDRGAYKPFNNITVGHFGFYHEDLMWSSRRKRNFNNIKDRDLVLVKVSEECVTAFGAKPSAGARSQYEVFKRNPDYNFIIHFHCPLKPGSKINVRPQKNLECGSLECGINTADGIVSYQKDIAAVMLDKHGPNILFKETSDPQEVINFIEENFDLSKSTSEV